ncbi:hypothetical protein M092_1776 [Parabacteroides distasonis str. 3776 D15 iv]|uniref:Uncharacterized protein n=1 Tax=Parabacteroides distasonis str. 3776 D15 i TaxID=1339342 RepID=A0AB34L7U7_PARDI|nr:hypothetical protein M091_0300 [Parabacteroides distasonis str. 3776 D15 i]KDS42834.1 hypothetical protein M090_0331 [Parabacteroides distasonis str. 3776 Po2 i]KDS73016.1 hypothetical protein M092_1776 [Parabacteroides distasonis str. 3776 D15 iv]
MSSAMSPADRQRTCNTLSPPGPVESIRFPDSKRISAIRKWRLRTASIKAVVSLPDRGTLAPLESSSPAISAKTASFRQGLHLARTHNGVSPSSFFTLTSIPLSSSMPTAVMSAK